MIACRYFPTSVLPHKRKIFYNMVRCEQNRQRFTSTDQLVTLEHCTESTLKGIAMLTLNRPKANALSKVMLAELETALDTARFDDSIRVLVISSSNPKIFCAGADLKERATMPQEEVPPFVHRLRMLMDTVASLPMPTIASMEGAAFGGGLELALACDMRIAGSQAVMGLTETSLGIIPGAGGTQRLPRLIGATKAKELIFTASRLNAAEAHEIGLVNRIVEAGKADSAALDLAQEIIQQAPIAVRLSKLAVDKGLQTDIATGMAFEKSYYDQVIKTEDRNEGLQAFKEKRPPKYEGK